MPLLEVELDQVFQILDQLSPQELVVVQERLRARQEATAQQPADLFSLSFDDYLALSDEEREGVQQRSYQAYRTWIDAELERRGAEWLLVCGGEVVEASPTLRDYPAREKLIRIGKERGRVPFVFVREPLAEESAWSVLRPRTH